MEILAEKYSGPKTLEQVPPMDQMTFSYSLSLCLPTPFKTQRPRRSSYSLAKQDCIQWMTLNDWKGKQETVTTEGKVDVRPEAGIHSPQVCPESSFIYHERCLVQLPGSRLSTAHIFFLPRFLTSIGSHV